MPYHYRSLPATLPPEIEAQITVIESLVGKLEKAGGTQDRKTGQKYIAEFRRLEVMAKKHGISFERVAQSSPQDSCDAGALLRPLYNKHPALRASRRDAIPA